MPHALTHNIWLSYRQNQIAQIRPFKAKNKTPAYHYGYTLHVTNGDSETTYYSTEEYKLLIRAAFEYPGEG